MSTPKPAQESIPSTIIRDASHEDMSEVTAIYDSYVQNSAATFEEISPTVDEIMVRYKSLLSMELPFLVATKDNKIFGYAYAGMYRTRSGYKYTVEDSVYVNPKYLGLGIGRQLLTELIKRCESLGYRQMIAVIGDSANTASIALHSQLGFRVIGALPATGRKFGRWIDTVLMQRALGVGASEPPISASSS
ncbi:MAG: N-acetyltransferase family protein [Rhodospirillaceae bacterium]